MLCRWLCKSKDTFRVNEFVECQLHPVLYTGLLGAEPEKNEFFPLLSDPPLPQSIYIVISKTYYGTFLSGFRHAKKLVKGKFSQTKLTCQTKKNFHFFALVAIIFINKTSL